MRGRAEIQCLQLAASARAAARMLLSNWSQLPASCSLSLPRHLNLLAPAAGHTGPTPPGQARLRLGSHSLQAGRTTLYAVMGSCPCGVADLPGALAPVLIPTRAAQCGEGRGNPH